MEVASGETHFHFINICTILNSVIQLFSEENDLQIARIAPCPSCEYNIRVSVKQLPRGQYNVVFFDGHDKQGRTKITICPHCRIELFKSTALKALTGLEAAQLSS